MDQSEKTEELCKKLKPVIGKQADILWSYYLAGDPDDRKRIATDIEILSEKLLKENLLSEKPILLNPPSSEECSGEYYLGRVNYKDRTHSPIFLREEDITKQIGIFSITGEGKTNLAFLLALQLLKKNIPFLVIDWKRSWRSLYTLKDAFPELKNLRLFTLGRDVIPFHWNPFRAPPHSDPYLWINTVSDVLEKSHLSGPGVGYYINNIYTRLFRGLKDDFFPTFYDGLREIKKYNVFERELRWKQSALRIFQAFTIGQSAKCFNSRTPIRIEEILTKPVILELDMELPKPLRLFITETLIRWVHLFRLSQGETQKLRHVLFLEEVHNLFQNNTFLKDNHNNIENIYREIRAFGQGIVSITQHPSLLPIYLLGNCHTQVFLGLQHDDDIKAARKSLFLKPTEEHYLSLLKTGECILKIKGRINPCLVKTPLIPVEKGQVTDSWLSVNTPWNFQPLNDDKISPKPRSLPTDKYDNPTEEKKSDSVKLEARHFELLKDIYNTPLIPITERYRRLPVNPKFGNKLKNELITHGLIQPRKIVTGTGWLTLFDISKKGILVLQDLGIEATQTAEGVIHKFWKFKTADEYRQKGYLVEIEKDINGRPDIIAEKDGIRIAIEIETGKSDAEKNRKRDLAAGFDEVITIFC